MIEFVCARQRLPRIGKSLLVLPWSLISGLVWGKLVPVQRSRRSASAVLDEVPGQSRQRKCLVTSNLGAIHLLVSSRRREEIVCTDYCLVMINGDCVVLDLDARE